MGRKKNQCEIGVGCGTTCIAGSFDCVADLGPGAVKVADTVVAVVMAKPPEPKEQPIAIPESKANAKLLAEERKRLVAEYGKAEVDALEAEMKKTLENAQISIAISPYSFLDVLKSGRFMSAPELGADAIEERGGKEALKERLEVESRVLGIKPKAPNSERPMYGFLTDKGYTAGKNTPETIEEYGGIGGLQVNLKSETKKRATVTGEDTLAGDNPMPSKFTKPNIASIATMENRLAAKEKAGSVSEIMKGGKKADSSIYLEAQVYGGVKLSDIQSVGIPKSESKSAEVTEAMSALKAQGIDYYLFDD